MPIVTALFASSLEAMSALETLSHTSPLFRALHLVPSGASHALEEDAGESGALLGAIITGAMAAGMGAKVLAAGPSAAILGGSAPEEVRGRVGPALLAAGVPAEEAHEAEAALELGFVVALFEVAEPDLRAARATLRMPQQALAASLRDTLPDPEPGHPAS